MDIEPPVICFSEKCSSERPNVACVESQHLVVRVVEMSKCGEVGSLLTVH